MARAWETLEQVERPEGLLALRRRGPDDFLITLGPRILMTSRASESERVLAELACAPLAARAAPRLLIGGLGMGCTLRAALDALPPDAAVMVAEIEPAVVRWCRGPLAAQSRDALADPRVAVVTRDVASVLAEAAGGQVPRFDAIALDLFEGPRGGRAEAGHPLYGDAALERLRRALRPEGVLALWSEAPSEGFVRRLTAAGFAVTTRRAGRGGRRHMIYLGRCAGAPHPSARAPGRRPRARRR